MAETIRTLYGLDPWPFALVFACFVASGVVRGFTGGLGANFLTAPVLAALIGPREAVPVILMLNLAGNARLTPRILSEVRWREGWPIFLFPALLAPVGAWVLFAVDEDVMRRAIAGMAAAFALLLLSGWRYRGTRMLALSAAAGSASGFLVGSITLGGPPLYLYLMAGPGDAATNRAQFVMYGNFVGASALLSFLAWDAFTPRVLALTVTLLVPAMAGIAVGDRLFRRTADELFRRITLWGLFAISLCVLVL